MELLQKYYPFDSEMTQRDYVEAVIKAYRSTPTVTGHVRGADRALAARLYRQQVPLSLVQAALVMAAIRRTFRPPPPLPPVRSLHYFVGTIEEFLDEPPDPEYIEMQRIKIARPDVYEHVIKDWYSCPECSERMLYDPERAGSCHACGSRFRSRFA